MEQSLHITDTQYLIALTIFFIPYAAFEVSYDSVKFSLLLTDATSQVPSNIVLKKLRPSLWLSFLMLGWGIMMVGKLSTSTSYRVRY